MNSAIRTHFMPTHATFLRGFDQFRASAIALIAANMLPLLGVIFLGWDAFSIVVLYWFENVVIGAINVLKMITCSPSETAIDWSKFGSPEKIAEIKKHLEGQEGAVEKVKLFHHGAKFFLVPFFAFHYGFFCFVHGIFVFALFGHDDFGGGFGPFGPLGNLFTVFREQRLWWAAAALAASHLYSFFVNYLGRGEYKRVFVVWLMFQPYARVVVLHVAILFGGFVAMMLGSNVGVLAILVIGKTVLDLHFHLLERLRDAAVSKKTMPQGTILDELPV
jgi:hypothetical protein